MTKPGLDGYATISNTVWTWFNVGAPTDPALSVPSLGFATP